MITLYSQNLSFFCIAGLGRAHISRLALSCFDTGLWLGINFGAWGAGRQTDCGSHDDLVIFRIFIRYFLLWFQQVVPRVARFSKAKTYEVETLWLQSSFLRVVMSFWWIIKGLSGPSHALVQMEVKLSLLLLFCLFLVSDERERLFERERLAAAMQIFLCGVERYSIALRTWHPDPARGLGLLHSRRTHRVAVSAMT